MSTAVPPRPRREAARRGGRGRSQPRYVATLELPGTPPSFNAVGLHSHWTKGRKAKQEWQQMIEVMLMKERVPRGMASVTASAEMFFKERRRRDEGNFRTILEKATGDALQNGWIPDDTPEFFRFGAVDLRAPHPESRTILCLEFVRV